MRILLIDDENAFVERLSARLSKRGFSVTSAEDGLSGLETFLNTPSNYDVILTDIKMPVMDGIELLKRIRNNDFDIPVIIMTGMDDMSQSVEALRHGAFDYLTKPIRLDQLYASLAKLETIRRASIKVIELLPFVSGEIQIQIPSRISYVESVIAYLQRLIDPICHSHGINLFNISLCIQEAMTNAIVHGNLDLPSQLKEHSWEKFESSRKERESDPEYGDKQVTIRYKFSPDHLSFSIEDEGKGFDPKTLPNYQDPDSLMSSGRGLLYILTFMDQVDWSSSGNIINMRKNLTAKK